VATRRRHALLPDPERNDQPGVGRDADVWLSRRLPSLQARVRRPVGGRLHLRSWWDQRNGRAALVVAPGHTESRYPPPRPVRRSPTAAAASSAPTPLPHSLRSCCPRKRVHSRRSRTGAWCPTSSRSPESPESPDFGRRRRRAYMGEGECMQIVANYLRFGHFWR
jgi:hypothetical protein